MNRLEPRLAPVAALAAALCVALSAMQASALRQTPLGGAPAGGPITYYIAEGRAETGFRPADMELARWALDAWRRSAASGLRLAPAGESNAQIRIYWAGPNSGEYGETRSFTFDGRRGAAVYIRPEMNSLGAEIARRAAADPLLRESVVYLTCVHELGHAFGLEHTRDFRDIMYFFGYGGDIAAFFERYRVQLRSRSDIATASGLSDGDVRRLRTLYPSMP